MCIGGGGGVGKFVSPVDPITSKVYNAVTPAPVKKVDKLPLNVVAGAVGKETTTKIINGGISTPDADKKTKNLLGE